MERGEDRRQEESGPPTLVMQSYQAMSEAERARLQRLGMGVLLFTVAVPMTAGIFVELHNAYWIFSGLGLIVGVCLMWPQLGVLLIGAVPSALAKILPSKKIAEILTPDRRSGEDRREAEG